MLRVLILISASACAVGSTEFGIDAGVSLVQTRASVVANVFDENACTTLTNHGTYFTAPIKVGKVGGSFNVVVDTGSDLTVIPSCSCKTCAGGKCDPEDVDGMSEISITYGSGTLNAALATDMITVGTSTAQMQNSLLLMTGNTFEFSIEGILGLGPAMNKHEAKGFLDEGSISQFTICFSHASSGKLVLGSAPSGQALGSVGQVHWGLGLNGISVGSASGTAIACSEGSSGSGSSTPCGAIPDSGTTMIIGPPDQLNDLLDGICDNWQACKDEASADGVDFGRGTAFRAGMVKSLVRGCNGINSMPKVYFSLTGSSGQQTVEISPQSYVIQSNGGCDLAFDEDDYTTKKNGPVWILGLPLFFEYNVGYNVAQNTLSFAKGSCSGCGSSFERASDTMWKSSSPPRKSSVDKSLPM